MLEQLAGTPLRVHILGGEVFAETISGSNDLALDNNVWTQYTDDPYGQKFGVRIDVCPINILQSIVAAMATASRSALPFEVALEDPHVAFDYMCVPDFDALGGRLYTFESDEEGIFGDRLINVEFRFIVKAEVS